MISRRQTLQLSLPLLAISLAAPSAADQAATPGGSTAPQLKDHALVTPHYLPHLMEFVGKAGLSDEEMQTLRTYAEEQVRPVLRQIFQQARALEDEIARAAIEGSTVEQLAPRLDRPAALKREAAELHIRCVNNMRRTPPADKYQRVVELAAAARAQ